MNTLSVMTIQNFNIYTIGMICNETPQPPWYKFPYTRSPLSMHNRVFTAEHQYLMSLLLGQLSLLSFGSSERMCLGVPITHVSIHLPIFDGESQGKRKEKEKERSRTIHSRPDCRRLAR